MARFCSSSVSTSLVCRSKYQLKLTPTARIIRLMKAMALTLSDALVSRRWSVGVMVVSIRPLPAALAVHLVGRLDNLWRQLQANFAGRLEIDRQIHLGWRHHHDLRW